MSEIHKQSTPDKGSQALQLWFWEDYFNSPDYLDIAEEYQATLDEQNWKTEGLLIANLGKTREGIFNLNTWYTNIQKDRPSVIIQETSDYDFSNQLPEQSRYWYHILRKQSDLFKEVAENDTKIGTYRDTLFLLRSNNEKNSKENSKIYWVFIQEQQSKLISWENTREEYLAITNPVYKDLKEWIFNMDSSSRSEYDLSLSRILELRDQNTLINKQMEALLSLVERVNWENFVMSDEERTYIDNLLNISPIENQNVVNFQNSIANQITQGDIESGNELEDVLSNLLDDSFKKIDQSIVTPFDILEKQYIDASEEDKLKLARVISAYMWGEWYDSDRLTNEIELANGLKFWWDVTSEEIWTAYREWWVAWVCRHHTSEVAIMLSRLWFKTWTLSTNNWDWRHFATWWQKEDGSYFLIDYWDYYEWKDPKELKAKYLAAKWWLDLREFVTDKDWNTIQIMQTDLEKMFEDTSSSIWTWSTLGHAKDISNTWVRITQWHSFDVTYDPDTSSKFEYKYWNWSVEGGVFYNKITDIDYADYISRWITLRGKVGDKSNSLWELWWWIKYAEHDFEWQNWKKAKYKSRAISIDYANSFKASDVTNIRMWLSWQSILAKNKENGYLSDYVENYGINLWIDHKLTPDVDISLDLWAGKESYLDNTRTAERVSSIWSSSSWVSLKKQLDNLWSISWKIYTEDGLWYKKQWLDLKLQTRDMELTAWYEETDNIDNWFLLDESIAYVWMQYKIHPNTSVNFKIDEAYNWESKDENIYLWLNMKF